MANALPNGYANYRQTAVETATPEKRLLMLFDGAFKFVNQGKLAMENKDYFATNTYLIKVQDILFELMISLDMPKGGDMAINLCNLYSFYRDETIKANMTKNPELLNPVIEFIRAYRMLWAEAAQKARVGA